jgi:hypothetical protein
LLIREVTGAVYRRGKWRGLDRLSPIKLLLAERHDPRTPRRRTVNISEVSDRGEPDADAPDSAGAGRLRSLPPCLVVHGDRDPICPLGQARQLTSVWGLSAPCTLAIVPFGLHGLTSILASMGRMAKYLGAAGRGESLAGCCVAFLERRVGTNADRIDGGSDGGNVLRADATTVVAAVDCCMLIVVISAVALSWP